jgi:hypothetical protein
MVQTGVPLCADWLLLDIKNLQYGAIQLPPLSKLFTPTFPILRLSPSLSIHIPK